MSSVASGPTLTGGDAIDPDYNRARLPRASATFVVAGKDAPEPVLPPTLRAV
ncbi:hypothetical protein [Methanoculleus sp. MH98A]|nr:hypothetical protein [Methanoculleus sp. MH98A]